MTTITDVACTVCGCVCDDLSLTVDAAGRLSRVERACALAEPWFRAQAETSRPIAEVSGRPVPLDHALARAAEILSRSRAPLIYGLSRSSTNGQRAACFLAEKLGATIDTTASLCHGPSIVAVQAVGESTSTLGEIRHRADLVIYWGCDPGATHPRHTERYAVFPPSQFVSGGRTGRTIVLIGEASATLAARLDRQDARADVVIPLPAGRDFEAITILRTLLAGREPAAASVASVGLDLAPLRDLVERMRRCRCGVVFFGLGLTGTGGGRGGLTNNLGHANVQVLLELVKELNGVTRFHARRMRMFGNVSGADSVLCWQTGYPFGVNFTRGYPRYNPGEYTADDVLSLREVDAALIVGSETLTHLSPESRDELERLPTIVLDYPGSEPEFTPSVRFTTSPYGLSSSGTAYRMDEVPLPLRAALAPHYPTDEEVLRRLEALVPEPDGD